MTGLFEIQRVMIFGWRVDFGRKARQKSKMLIFRAFFKGQAARLSYFVFFLQFQSFSRLFAQKIGRNE